MRSDYPSKTFPLGKSPPKFFSSSIDVLSVKSIFGPLQLFDLTVFATFFFANFGKIRINLTELYTLSSNCGFNRDGGNRFDDVLLQCLFPQFQWQNCLHKTPA